MDQPGDLKFTLNRDEATVLYSRLSMSASDTVAGSRAINSMIDKLEGVGYRISEDATGNERIVFTAVPGTIDLVITRNELRAIRRNLVGALRPGSREQVVTGYARRRILPLLETLGMRRSVEKDAFGSTTNPDDEEPLLDIELEAKEKEEVAKKAKDEKKKEG